MKIFFKQLFVWVEAADSPIILVAEARNREASDFPTPLRTSDVSAKEVRHKRPLPATDDDGMLQTWRSRVLWSQIG
ncbi:hypothetical protein D9M72_647460 [compost metagenome]